MSQAVNKVRRAIIQKEEQLVVSEFGTGDAGNE
jgi:hypothetical protein